SGGRLGSLDLHQYVARGVPELVAEVLVALDTPQVEANIAAHRRERTEREAQRIGAVSGNALRELLAGVLLDLVFEMRLHESARALCDERLEIDAVDQIEGVDDVALRFRHLVAVLVANEPGDVDLAEGNVAGELEPHHDHAGDPEEDDVETRDEHAGRVERLQLVRLFRPAERRERPERRREPRVEHVFVAHELDFLAALRTRLCLRIGLRARDIDIAFVVVPRRNLMAPPELAADAPILDVVHPLEVGLRPVLRDEADATVFDRLDRGFGKRSDADVPLIREPRLEDLAAAIAARYRQLVRLDFLEQPLRFEIRNDLLARLEAAFAPIALGYGVVQDRILIEDVDERQVVPFADFVVVEVVPRRDLDAAGSEFGIDVGIADNRNRAIGQR